MTFVIATKLTSYVEQMGATNKGQEIFKFKFVMLGLNCKILRINLVKSPKVLIKHA